MIRSVVTAFLLVGATLVAAQDEVEQQKSYENYKVMNVLLRDVHDAEMLKVLEGRGVDVWTPRLVRNQNATVLVPPHLEHFSLRVLKANNMQHWIVNENFQESLDEERRDNAYAQRDQRIVGTFATYTSIEAWLKSTANACGNNCILSTIGTSTNGKTIYVLRIGKNIKAGAVLSRIFTESTIHAREWLAQAASIYAINEMVTKIGSDASISNALSKYEFDFVVVANPDGYEYTHTNDRMWRKTRSVNTGSSCRGTDPNRNFNFHWCGEGTSTNPCSDTYCGKTAFSEPETKAVSNYILSIKASTKGYVAVHSYCQVILVPYGYTTGAYPSDYRELVRVADSMASAMQSANGASGKKYTVGNTADLLYPAAGGSDDWAKGVAGIKYAYTIEMRPVCTATNGFVVSTSEIVPAGKELLAGFIQMTVAMA